MHMAQAARWRFAAALRDARSERVGLPRIPLRSIRGYFRTFPPGRKGPSGKKGPAEKKGASGKNGRSLPQGISGLKPGNRSVRRSLSSGGKFSDRVISCFGVRGFPPFRQQKGERMGHGADIRTSDQRPSPAGGIEPGVPVRHFCFSLGRSQASGIRPVPRQLFPL